jgi:hypothetical protein
MLTTTFPDGFAIVLVLWYRNFDFFENEVRMGRKLGVRLWVFLILAAMVHAGQNPKEDQSKDGKSKDLKFVVRGKVVNRDGAEVPNAVVTIIGPKGPITQTTDSTGSYSFEGPAGKYTITAKAGGKSGTLSEEIAGNKELKSLKVE